MLNSITINKFVASLNELKSIEGFTIFDKPVKFNQQFKDEDFINVETWRPYVAYDDSIGCCWIAPHAFEWKNNTIISFDGEKYNEDMDIIGYKYDHYHTGKRGEKLQIILFKIHDGGDKFIPIKMNEEEESA